MKLLKNSSLKNMLAFDNLLQNNNMNTTTYQQGYHLASQL